MQTTYVIPKTYQYIFRLHSDVHPRRLHFQEKASRKPDQKIKHFHENDTKSHLGQAKTELYVPSGPACTQIQTR